jgi:hypothetical protein
MTTLAYLVAKETLGAENLGTVNTRPGVTGSATWDSRIVGGKLDVHIKHTSFVWTAWRAWYGGLPAVQTVLGGCEGDGPEVFLLRVGYLTVNALHGHLGDG